MDPPAGDEGNLPVYNASDEEEQFPPVNVWEVLRGNFTPSFLPAHPCSLPLGVAPLEVSAPRLEHPEEGPPSAPPRSGVLAPTTPGFIFSTKRIREEDSRDSAPSTLGFCCPMVPLLVAQRPPVSFWQAFRPLGVAPPEDSAPQVERPEEAPSSALQGQECSLQQHQASSSPPRGSGKMTPGTRHPSTSGPGFSTKRIREDDSRDSAPSTLGLCCPMVPLLVAQRPPVSFWQAIRPLGVAPPEDSAPQVERPEEAPSSAPPSTSGLGFSTKRTWEEACREEDYTYTLNSPPSGSENFIMDPPAGDEGNLPVYNASDEEEQFPPVNVWEVLRGNFTPSFLPAHPCSLPLGVAPLEVSAPRLERPEEGPPSAPPRSGVLAPTTPGFIFSTKRIREEDSRDSAPSTLGFCCPMVPLLVAQRPPVSFWQAFRPLGVAPPEDSAPQVERPEEAPSSAPPRSGVFASTTPGFVFSTKRFREDDSRDSAPSTSGPGFFTKRIREDDSRDSAPSTLGLCCPMVPLLVAQRPPVSFWQAIRPLGVAPPEDSAPQVERPEEAPSSAPPSTSGLGFSTKRTWEEACREEDYTYTLNSPPSGSENFIMDPPAGDEGNLPVYNASDEEEQFPPVNVWEVLRGNFTPSFLPAHPCSLPLGVAPLEVSAPRLERPEEGPPSAPPRSGVLAPTTPGFIFSTKRIREEDSRDSAPSTLGFCCPMVPLLVAQRPPVSFWQAFRPLGVAPPEDSAPQVERPEEAPSSAPPRSGVFASTTPGFVFSTKRFREDDSRDSAPSPSGPGFSTKRIREDDSRDSAPSTLGLCCPMVPLLVAQRHP
ncbi:Major capsid protein [Dissostichus eleginoides]|uniref:Major capsid protein n=1 Tax=Dissostichus eleginoides TaxID=100907 RepID=A0AAD9BI56_DISEL|nr:Major capsid protein [Dissostichus eleginoides]